MQLGNIISEGIVVHAGGPSLLYFGNFLLQILILLRILVPILVALALLLFIWGLVTFIARSGDEEAVKEGKQRMIWGIIALFVIVSVWGLVGLLSQITGVKQGGNVPIPFSKFI